MSHAKYYWRCPTCQKPSHAYYPTRERAWASARYRHSEHEVRVYTVLCFGKNAPRKPRRLQKP